MEINQLVEKIKEIGFETVTELNPETLKALPEVRDMCAVNTCGLYGKRWSCPPGCGTIEECEAKMRQYSRGIIVQTVGDIEDSLDFEGIIEVKKMHDRRFITCVDKLKKDIEDLLPLGDGGCSRCKECTYPDSPCRFPDMANSSMEAFGLFVSDVCKKNGIEYNYGQGKMCYTGCFLFNE